MKSLAWRFVSSGVSASPLACPAVLCTWRSCSSPHQPARGAVNDIGEPSAFAAAHDPASPSGGVTPVVFGKRRRLSAQQRANAEAAERALFEDRQRASPDEEEAAWAEAAARGFAVKPPFLSWSSFVAELKRYDTEWALGSATKAIYVWTLTSQSGSLGGTTGKERLCQLRSVGAKSAVVFLSLTATEEMFSSASRRQTLVPFIDEDDRKRLLLLSLREHASTPPGVHADIAAAAQEEAERRVAPLSRLAPGTNWLLIRGSIAEEDPSLAGPPLFEVSLATFAYWQVMALVSFLQATQFGVQNFRRVDRRQMNELQGVHDRLRKASGMHAAPWPIDPNLLRS